MPWTENNYLIWIYQILILYSTKIILYHKLCCTDYSKHNLKFSCYFYTDFIIWECTYIYTNMFVENAVAARFEIIFKSQIVTAGNGTSQIAPWVLSITWNVKYIQKIIINNDNYILFYTIKKRKKIVTLLMRSLAKNDFFQTTLRYT